MYDEGHFVANHGYSHVYSQIYASPENVLNEYNQCNDAIKKQLEKMNIIHIYLDFRRISWR